MQGVFFYSSILAFASGIFLRSFFVVGWIAICWLVFITFVLGLWWHRNKTTDRAPYILLFVVLLGSFALGMARLELVTTLATPSLLLDKLNTKVELTGVVVAEPEVTAKSTRLTVATGEDRVLVSTDRYAEVSYGDEIAFTGKLKEPEVFETEFGRTFNYPGYLAVRDIFYTVSFATIEVESSGNGNIVIEKLLVVKKKFLASIQAAIPEPEVGLGAGLLLGVTSSLGDELEDAFRATGIIHIVVLSGANIMLVVLFVMYMLALVLPVRPRVIVGIISIILFALLVGLSATVVRASIMAMLILIALGLGRRYAIMRALFFAGFVMLLINPLLLVYDVGFQLSFLATLGLITVAPQFENLMSAVPKNFKLKEYFLATVATQIAILPLLLYQIGQFSVVAILVNMLVLPMVAVAMLATFITGVLGLLSPILASVAGVFAYLTLTYIIVIATWFATLPFAAFVVPALPFFIVPIVYVVIGYIVYKLITRDQTKEIALPEMSEWTVVEEVDILITLNKNADEPSSPAPLVKIQPLPPIFFR